MELHYYHCKRGNFGDDLNPAFFQEICPNFKKIRGNKLIGIGTLLNNSISNLNNSIVFGSGYGQGRPVDLSKTKLNILGVRGPISAMSIRHPPDSAIVIGDPALILPKLPAFNNGISATNKKKIIALHHRTAEFWDFQNSSNSDFYYLDPAGHTLNTYIETIKQADFVLAESLHAAIIATAYGIPFIRTNLLGKVDETKWLDYYLSVNINNLPIAAPLPIPSQNPLRRVALGLTSRKIFNQSFQRAFCQTIPQRNIELLELAANELIKNQKLHTPDSKAIIRLQDKIMKAIDKLSILSKN